MDCYECSPRARIDPVMLSIGRFLPLVLGWLLAVGCVVSDVPQAGPVPALIVEAGGVIRAGTREFSLAEQRPQLLSWVRSEKVAVEGAGFTVGARRGVPLAEVEALLELLREAGVEHWKLQLGYR